MRLEVGTTHGRVQGRERRGVALFAGIPYAAPPVGALRWAPPSPPRPWSGVRDATSFGPAAPQLPGTGALNAHRVDWDEDCLTLNVSTPNADDAGRAVMVWIHGGAFRHGSGSVPWYDGTSFARNGDIVVVTLNYRLGALGYARLPGAPTSGINGILDQVAALEWVRDNISTFGGDPTRVTIAGQSAGAMSVATLTAMPQARGLFRAGIAQSGAGHHVVARDVAEAAGERLLEELNISTLEDALAVPPVAILEAQARVEQRRGEFMVEADDPFYPCVDGEILAATPIELIQAGAGADVALLTGTTGDEATLWGVGSVTASALDRTLAKFGHRVEDLLPAYRGQFPHFGPGQLAVAYATDRTFRIPAIRLAEARALHGAQTWMYLFDWKSQAFDGALGATHALDLGFTFANLDAPGFELLAGVPDPPEALSDLMHKTWIAFIRDGSPLHGDLEIWPSYSVAERAVYEFSHTPRLLDDPQAPTREAWSGIR